MVETTYNLQDLLKLPVAERLRLARTLIDSALEENGSSSPVTAKPDASSGRPALIGLMELAGRFSGGPGNTAERADEILRDEVDSQSGFTIKSRE
jgi:hypothetical protein